MIDETRVGRPESPKVKFTVNQEADAFTVSSPHVDLASEGDPLRFSITLEKIATPIDQGTVIENITIDNKSPKLQEMYRQARALREIPERERPRQILELLRSNVQFAYEDVMSEVAKGDPELSRWVAENTGIGSSNYKPLSLSEVVDSGYAVCRHLSVAMLALAKEAGMEGAYLTYTSPISAKVEPNPKYLIKNVIRKDTNQPLFKSITTGEAVWGGHAWVELRTSDGNWIPVDPSTQLVGDNPEGLETFRDANYISYPTTSFKIGGLPEDVWPYDLGELWFLPAEKTHTGIIKVNSLPKQKPIRIRSGNEPESEEIEDSEIWPKPTTYQGPLEIRVYSQSSLNGLSAAVVDVKPI